MNKTFSFSFPFDYMNEQKKMTVWVIAKLLDGLKVSEINEILECLKLTVVNDSVWNMPQSAFQSRVSV